MTSDLPSSIAPPHTLTTVRGRGDLLLPLVIGVGSFIPLVVEFFLNLNTRAHYQFFPLVLIAAGFLGVQRLREFTEWRVGYTRLSVTCFVLAAAGLLLATLIASPWSAYASLLVCFAGLMHARGGWRLVRVMLPIGLLLLTLLPPPLNLDTQLITRLQRFATQAGSQFLDALQIPHLVSGNTIVVRGKHLFVEEACSGIHSLTSVLAVTLIYLVLMHRHWLPSMLVLALAVVWVLAANVIRIVTIALAEEWYRHDLSQGTVHYLLGTALYLLCIGLMISSDCLFTLFTRPKSSAELPPVTRRVPPRSAGGFFRLRQAVAAVGIVCFLLGSVRMGVLLTRATPAGNYPLALTEDAVPAQVGGWIRQHSTPINKTRSSALSHGDYSSIWNYSNDRWTASVAVDYAFPTWHDLTVCYRGTGWEIRREETIIGSIGPIKVIEMSHPEIGEARLYYTCTDGAGNHPGLFKSSFGGAFFDRFSHSMLPPPATDYFQVQLMLRGSTTAVPPTIESSARALFEEAVRTVRPQLPKAEVTR